MDFSEIWIFVRDCHHCNTYNISTHELQSIYPKNTLFIYYRSVSIAETKTFYKPPWFWEVSEEFTAARAKVAVCDYSSFAKFDLWSSGTEVVDFLQKLCSNDM